MKTHYMTTMIKKIRLNEFDQNRLTGSSYKNSCKGNESERIYFLTLIHVSGIY